MVVTCVLPDKGSLNRSGSPVLKVSENVNGTRFVSLLLSS